MVKVDLSLELNPTRLAEAARKFVSTVRFDELLSTETEEAIRGWTSVFCDINDLREEFAVGMLSVSTHSNQLFVFMGNESDGIYLFSFMSRGVECQGLPLWCTNQECQFRDNASITEG